VLKGRAAEIRAIAKPLLAVWLRYMDAEDTVHVWVKLALEKSIEVESILLSTRGRYVVPKPLDDEFEKAVQSYVALNAALRSHFGDRLKIFAYTIKGHYMLHLGATARWLHPHLGWCYSGEDFMQKIKKLVRSCCCAVQHFQVGPRVLQKYVLALYHRLANAVCFRR